MYTFFLAIGILYRRPDRSFRNRKSGCFASSKVRAVLIAPYASNVVSWSSAISFFQDCPPDRQLPYRLNMYSILYGA